MKRGGETRGRGDAEIKAVSPRLRVARSPRLLSSLIPLPSSLYLHPCFRFLFCLENLEGLEQVGHFHQAANGLGDIA